MDWCVAIRHIDECSAAIRGQCEAFVDNLKTLLAFLDHEDVLVAYAAKEKLWKVLSSDRIVEPKCVNDVVNVLLMAHSASWRREASGFRLQLLRQLVKDETEDSTSSEEEGQSGCIVEYSYLHALLENLALVRIVVHSILTPLRRLEEDGECLTSETAPYSVQYEVLAFLSDFVKQLYRLEIEWCSRVEMMLLMDDVFVMMDYESQPKFVTCAALDVQGNFQGGMKVWKDQSQDDDDGSLYSKWVEKSLVWLMQSPCTYSALRLLNGKETSLVASQEAFISQSGRYPFLQQWLLCLSRMCVAFLEASHSIEEIAAKKELQVLIQTAESHVWGQLQLPSRQQLFEVLAEQDDVMIEVLNGLTLMAALLIGTDSSNLLVQWYPAFTAHLTTEYDPDLLFADLVDTLGRDHLVVLDLLVSNETSMLEYVMRYLRRLSRHWKVSMQKLRSAERLDVVMSVLIRLRLEIDRLVVSDIFPYSAGPLTRRLLAVEQLYEEPGDGQL